MRHRIAGKKLNRTTKHRNALLKNLAAQIIQYGEITTTVTKAKVIQPKIDKLITTAKKGTLHSRRQIESFFNKKPITNKLFDHLAPNLLSRTSGYTRITKLNYRRGDNTLLAKIELVDKIVEPEIVSKEEKSPARSAKQVKTQS